ncbi:hypothetical protein RDSD_002900 [Oleidesulfovibrio alaskensis]|jgi:hypothetical protein
MVHRGAVEKLSFRCTVGKADRQAVPCKRRGKYHPAEKPAGTPCVNLSCHFVWCENSGTFFSGKICEKKGDVHTAGGIPVLCAAKLRNRDRSPDMTVVL